VFLGGLNPQLQQATTSIENRDGIKRANNKQTNRNDFSNNTGHGPWLVSEAAEPVVGAAHTMLHIFAYGPKTGPAFLRFFLRCDIVLGGGVGGCNNVLSLRYHQSSSVNTRHATLYTFVHFCCASVNTLHATLYTSVVLW